MIVPPAGWTYVTVVVKQVRDHLGFRPARNDRVEVSVVDDLPDVLSLAGEHHRAERLGQASKAKEVQGREIEADLCPIENLSSRLILNSTIKF